MSGHMSIWLTYLNRAFHGLSIDISHDPKHFFQYFGWLSPLRGSRVGPPLRPLLIHNMKIYRKSASYLIRWGHAPLKKSYKITIFRSFSAADGQMSGQMSIQLTYLYRAFHALSIDMSHDHKHVFLILGWLPPPPGGVTCHPRQILVHDMKI